MAINFLKRKDQDDIADDIISIGEDETNIWGSDTAMIEIDEADSEEENDSFTGINEAAVTLKLVTPKDLSEVVKVADYLTSGSSVVLNIEEMADEEIVRFMDYLQGVLYVIKGNMKQVSKTTFVATPNNVGIESDTGAEASAD